MFLKKNVLQGLEGEGGNSFHQRRNTVMEVLPPFPYFIVFIVQRRDDKPIATAVQKMPDKSQNNGQ